MRPDIAPLYRRPTHRTRRVVKVGTSTFLIAPSDPRLKLTRAEDLEAVAAEMRERAQS